jgi:uncharacterized protein (TIGR03085 family)
MAHYAVDERHALAKTLRSARPDGPTLCGDWTVAQLTAHLVLRERSVVELLGRLPSRRLHQLAQREIDELVARERYHHLVDAVEAGPSPADARWPLPTALIWSVPVVRERANLLEYLVHHEDVRRAGSEWQPRPLPEDLRRQVWKRLPGLTLLTMRAVPMGVALVWPGHGEVRTLRARRRGIAVRVSGDPVELALFAFGRETVARVEYGGDEQQVAQLLGARIGL